MREKIIRISLLKKDLFRKILTSISQNNNVINSIKIYTNYNKQKILVKNSKQTKKHKICICTGKRSSILKGFSFSRYKIKNLIIANKYTNLKKHNW